MTTTHFSFTMNHDTDVQQINILSQEGEPMLIDDTFIDMLMYTISSIDIDEIDNRLLREHYQEEPATKPVTRHTLKSLEVTTITKDPTCECCSICQCDYQDGEQEMKLPCGHAFHPDCLTPWLDANDTCPMCRQPVHIPMTKEYATILIQSVVRRHIQNQRLQRLQFVGIKPSELHYSLSPYQCISCRMKSRLARYLDPINFSSCPINPPIATEVNLCETCYSGVVLFCDVCVVVCVVACAVALS